VRRPLFFVAVGRRVEIFWLGGRFPLPRQLVQRRPGDEADDL
jgi:hypothetical protein